MSSREGSMRCGHATDFYSPASTCVFGARACNHVILRCAVGLQVRADLRRLYLRWCGFERSDTISQCLRTILYVLVTYSNTSLDPPDPHRSPIPLHEIAAA